MDVTAGSRATKIATGLLALALGAQAPALAESGSAAAEVAPWEQPLQPIAAIAVRFEPGAGDVGLARALAAGAGLVTVGGSAFHTDGWFRLDLAGAVDAAELWTPIAALAADPVVAFATPLWSTADGASAAPTDALLVRLTAAAVADGLGLWDVAPDLVVLGVEVGGLAGTYRARNSTPDGFAVLERARSLRQHDAVLWAESDCLVEGASAQVTTPVIEPGDPLYWQQWVHENQQTSPAAFDIDLDTPAAWASTQGSADAPVLVIDVGVDLAHPDLVVALGADFTGQGGGGGPVGPCDKHGTPVAGCVAAIIDNDIGVAGAASGAPLYSARAFIASASCTGAWSTEYSWTADALAWGAAQGARVSVNSNYYNVHSTLIADAYAQTRAGGMVHFASAGNSSGAITWPAALPTVHAVTALTAYGTLATFSCTGPEAGFTAPGVSVWSTDVSGLEGFVATDVSLVSGTSYAAPYAASVAALVLAVAPTLTPDQVDQVLIDTAGDLGAPGHDPSFGHGLTRAGAAVKYVLGLERLLEGFPAELALDIGGTHQLDLAAGPAAALRSYLVVGGASGPAAPSGEGIGSLPLAVDAYSLLTVAQANSGPFQQTFGVLDGKGHGLASIVIAPGTDPALAGVTLHHAYFVFTAALDAIDGPASEAATLDLVAHANDLGQAPPPVANAVSSIAVVPAGLSGRESATGSPFASP